MKRIAKLAIVIMVFNVVSAFGQTRAEIEAKFGQPVKAYPVGENVLDESGVCFERASLSHDFLSTTFFFHHNLPDK